MVEKMHELALAQNIVQIATAYARKEGARKVTGVDIEAGTLSGVVPEALRFSLEVSIRGTLLEGAKINYHHPAGIATCMSCGKNYEMSTLYTPCPRCGNTRRSIIAGKELRLQSIVVE